VSRARQPKQPWWRTWFDRTFLTLHEPLFTEAESRAEVAAMIEMLGLPVGARILDVPCGWGRHTRLLPQAGYRTTGADLSIDLLERARADGTTARARSRARKTHEPWFAAADLRTLPFIDHGFDAVIDVFTSIGLFASDRDEVRALRELHRVLAPGGRLLLETMHRDDVVAHYAERDGWSLPDGTEVTAQRSFDPLTGISREKWTWRRGTERGARSHALRLRTASEIAALLRRARFRSLEVFGDWDGAPFTHRSPRMIAVAERGDDERPAAVTRRRAGAAGR
jgi:ubiquinone/menaquinone biosynthesis C-methylase UbiE